MKGNIHGCIKRKIIKTFNGKNLIVKTMPSRGVVKTLQARKQRNGVEYVVYPKTWSVFMS